jgi:two-component system, chemotaxis family, chemotaxis protein CheY
LEAADGKEALNVLMDHKVHLILSDLEMPKVSRLDLLKALRDHSSFKEMPFIVLTLDISEGSSHQSWKLVQPTILSCQ